MRRTLARLLTVGILAWLAAPATASAQTDRPTADLVGSVSAAASLVGEETVAQVHVRWQVAESLSGNPVRSADLIPVNRFEVVARSSLRGPLVRERDPQWSEHDLVVVAIDATGRETSWQKMQDPRVLRVELPGPTGQLSGEVLYRPEVELVLAVPDVTTTAFQIYETHWSGEQFTLRQLGRVEVSVP